MIEATCLCGQVRIEAPDAPSDLTSCNCAACRRYGALWSYYPQSQVRIEGDSVGYARHDIPGQAEPRLAFHHCSRCGCLTHWASLNGVDRMGVNARLMDPAIVTAARIHRLDGADTWRELTDDDGPA